MDHVAIDLGGSQSQICVRSPDGKIVVEQRTRTKDLPLFLSKRPPSRVILETCAEAFGIADAAKSVGHEVRVVPATLVRALGIGSRGVKTDRRDAQLLSEASCRMDLPAVHVPSATSRQRKTKCGMRDVLVHSRTMMISNVRGFLRATSRRPRKGSTATFPVPAMSRRCWSRSSS